MIWKVTTLFLAAAVALIRSEVDNLTKAALEVKNLLASVHPEIRPSVNNEPTLVKVQNFIRDIDIDEANGKLTLDLLLRLGWNDNRLAFSTEGVDYVVMLNPRLAWIPDLFFMNGIVTYHKAVQKETFLRIYSNGNVTFSIRMSVNMKCSLDKSRSVNGTHSCIMKMGSYAYTDRDVTFEWEKEKPAVIIRNFEVGAFSLDGFEASPCQAMTATGNYSCLKLEIFLRRDICA